MYQYDTFDQQLLNERIAEFRDQVRRWQAGELSGDEFRPLRVRNGLYIQRHAPVLRIAVPYGLMNSAQLRALARIARQYARGRGHFTTRHNLHLYGLTIGDAPDILAELATVGLHGIQTSGNCARNITTDSFAGVAADEIIDPHPLAYAPAADEDAAFAQHRRENAAFAHWLERCTHPHRVSGYRAVTLPLKKHGATPGNISSEQMETVADLADHFSFGKLRIAHEPNIILADVREAWLYTVWLIAKGAGLATPPGSARSSAPPSPPRKCRR